LPELKTLQRNLRLKLYIYNKNNSNNKILIKTIIIVIIIKIIFYPFISLISNFAEICP